MSHDAKLAAMDRLVDRLERLHSAPQVACQVLTLLQDENFETYELVQCLETDPALATSVLRLVNSSYFGLRCHVASLHHAVSYLGSRSLRLAVLSFGLLQQLAEDTPAKVYQDYWRRSLTMASVASRLAIYRRELPADEAYIAGLLSDIGVLVLSQLETSSYVKLYERLGQSDLLLESERELYGFDHGELGARLLQRWNIPRCLSDAVAQHHQPPSSGDLLVIATHIANLMADALWTPRSSVVHETRQLLELEFGLDMDGFITLAVDCKQMIQDAAELYQVQLSGSIDCKRLVEAARCRYVAEAMEAAMDWDSLAQVAREGEVM